MIVQVHDATATGPDGKTEQVKVLVMADGQVQTQVMMREQQAREVAAALEGRQVVVAQPQGVVVPPGVTGSPTVPPDGNGDPAA